MALGIAEVISGAIGPVANLIDELFTSDEERLSKQEALERLRQIPGIAQVKLNTVEAAHRTIWVAGWRPFIGWTGGSVIAYHFILQPMAQYGIRIYAALHPEAAGLAEIADLPTLDTGPIFALIMGMLGMGGLRSWEKNKGLAK